MAPEKNNSEASTVDRELVLTRVFDFPRELVFAAYTDPRHLPQWWGPKGFTITTHAIDVRVGGTWRFVMHGPDGVDYDSRIVYREITKPERIVFVYGSDKDNDPERFEVTVTFEKQGNKTKLVQRSVLPTKEQRDTAIGFGAIELGQTTLDKLGAHLAERAKATSSDARTN